jgi:acetyl-CoA C-acetyltransferase
MKGKAAVVGVHEHPTRWAPNKTQYQIMAESARGALEDAGLTLKDVDGLFTSGVGAMGVVSLAEHLNLNPNYLDSTSIGGSSFVAHTIHAAAAISAGLCSVALILYGSTASSDRFAIGTGGGLGSDPPDQFEAMYGPTTVGDYALVAQRHMYEFGTTSEQLAEIAVTIRRHAAMNPAAKFRDPITVEDVLASRIVSSPLHLLDCCIITDGGGALVVTSAERARDLKKKPVSIWGGAEACYHTSAGMRDLTDAAARQSGPRAMAMAGITHKPIDMCMI